MRSLLAWLILLAVFALAGEGFNLFRVYIWVWFENGRLVDLALCLLGLVIGFLGIAFLGGYVYYRDKKRGKVTKEGWRGRPVRRVPRPRDGRRD